MESFNETLQNQRAFETSITRTCIQILTDVLRNSDEKTI